MRRAKRLKRAARIRRSRTSVAVDGSSDRFDCSHTPAAATCVVSIDAARISRRSSSRRPNDSLHGRQDATIGRCARLLVDAGYQPAGNTCSRVGRATTLRQNVHTSGRRSFTGRCWLNNALKRTTTRLRSPVGDVAGTLAIDGGVDCPPRQRLDRVLCAMSRRDAADESGENLAREPRHVDAKRLVHEREARHPRANSRLRLPPNRNT
jgi:hypothetical protein